MELATMEKKKMRREAPLRFYAVDLLRSFREPALVACGGVLVNQSLARCAVEKLDRRELFLRVSSVGRPLERCTKRGFLGAIADRSGA